MVITSKRHRGSGLLTLVHLVALSSGAFSQNLAEPADDCGTSTGNTALIDLRTGSYNGFIGGLYPDGENRPPVAHLEAALRQANSIRPLNAKGRPDEERGLIGFLGVGLSVTAHHFAAFERQQDANPARNPTIIFLNGAKAGNSAERMVDPAARYWRGLAERLTAAGVTAEQVQVAWIEQRRAPGYLNRIASKAKGGGNKLTDGEKLEQLAFPQNARALRDDLERIVQNLDAKFPNLKLCYVSDRVYEGYGKLAEPRGFETGFGVKWLIEGQIAGRPELNWSPDLGPVRAPLLLWGPYLWADGAVPNSLGTRWCRADYETDLVHPSASGEAKVAALLTCFFASDPTAAPWFDNPYSRALLWVDATDDAHVRAAKPDGNFGAERTLLSAGGDDAATAFMRFDLSGLKRPARHVKLSFRTAEEHRPPATSEVFVVADDDWTESTLVFSNAPSLGRSLGWIPHAGRDSTKSLDVTFAVNAHDDDILTLALAPTGTKNGPALVVSRDGGHAPRLVVVP